MSERSRCVRALLAIVGTLLISACGNSSLPPLATEEGSTLQIKSLSNRADLVSGGDALLELSPGPLAQTPGLTVMLDRREVSSDFALRPNGRVMGLVTGLAEGSQTLTVRLPDGSGASLTLTNHPNGGPIFAGAQLQPWPCLDGASDTQCNRAVSYAFKYRSNRPGATGFAVYDPANPPGDVATTTTDQGRTVPFVIRVETGAQDRGIYQIAVLYDPGEDWQPWAPQPGWNGKTYITGGNGCGNTRGQRTGANVEVAEPLGRGFMVMTTSLAHNTLNCNLVVQAEALMMLKERVTETYGPIRYTIGSGCSGGSMYQQHVANAYPGIFDGIIPACSFPDAWSTMMEVFDCRLLVDYWSQPQRWAPGVVWPEAQQAAVAGQRSSSVCQSWVNGYGLDSVLSARLDPRAAGAVNPQSCQVTQEQAYDPESNPRGVRCGLQDAMASLFGLRPADGFARRPIDNIGVQYGLGALQAGQISAAQFLDLNTKIGARNIDFDPVPGRIAADESALFTAYRGGLVNDARAMDRVPIIDLRGHSAVEIHHDYRSYVMRERLRAVNGHHDNQVIWTGAIALIADLQYEKQALTVMDTWLAGIEADSSERPLEEKVLRHKPAAAVDRCTDGNGRDLPAASCPLLFPYFTTPRIAAGMPFTDDVLKCALKPPARSDYAPVTFTEDQWAELMALFPQGVCDYRQPGIGQQASQPWLDYRPGPAEAAQPMPRAPVSAPLP